MPAATQTLFTPSALLQARRMRQSLLQGLTGGSLAAALSGFEAGNLRQAAQLWELIATRDDVISSVKPKREKALARRSWEIVQEDNSPEADAQKEKLLAFWNSARAVNAYDRNERGGFSKLVKQMLSAVSYKYAAHHIVWKPGKDEIKAEFEFVPLSFFENTTGELRFCPTGLELAGEPLEPGQWMVTTGDGIMVAACICYLAKRNSWADWMVFSERFGIPGILGRTPASADSDAGRALVDAVTSISNDWAACLFGDDKKNGSTIELLEVKGGAASLPFPALIERVDRRLAAMWRGADLSSISSSSGQGTGASLQGDETALIEMDDALNVEETLEEVSNAVLRWYYGPNVKVKAYLKISVPAPEDLKLLIEAIKMLVSHGAPVSIEAALERLGFPIPKDGAELLRPPLDYSSSYSEAFKDGATDGSGFDLMNERSTQTNAILEDDAEFMREAAKLLAQASADDRAKLAKALQGVLSNPDELLFDSVREFIAALPQHIAANPAQVKAWERIIAAALVRGWASASPEKSNA
jgi:phage gp29-like protein